MDELTHELRAAVWHKSTWSGPDGGNCVEVANLSGGRRAVRDSKDRRGAALVVPAREWSAFIVRIKMHEVG